MYGESYATPAGGSYFNAGISPACFKGFDIVNASSEKFTGTVLDCTFVSPDGTKTFKHRMFPVVESKIPEQYQAYVKNFTAKASNNGKTPKTLKEYTVSLYEKFGGEVRAIACEFMAPTKFDEYSSQWKAFLKEKGKTSTFEGFIKMVNAAIKAACPDFEKQEGRIMLGYSPNGKYLKTPSFNVDTSCYFTTDPSKHLELYEFSKFTFIKSDERPSGYEMANVTEEDAPVSSATTASNETVSVEDDDDLPF